MGFKLHRAFEGGVQDRSCCLASAWDGLSYLPGIPRPSRNTTLQIHAFYGQILYGGLNEHKHKQTVLGWWFQYRSVPPAYRLQLDPSNEGREYCFVVSWSIEYNQMRWGYADKDERHLQAANWYLFQESCGLRVGACKLGIGLSQMQPDVHFKRSWWLPNLAPC